MRHATKIERIVHRGTASGTRELVNNGNPLILHGAVFANKNTTPGNNYFLQLESGALPETVYVQAFTKLDFDGVAETITRVLISGAIGSWIEEGFLPGQRIDVKGSDSNDGQHIISNVAATVLTVGATITTEAAQFRVYTVTAPTNLEMAIELSETDTTVIDTLTVMDKGLAISPSAAVDGEIVATFFYDES